MSAPDPKPDARIVATREEWTEITRVKFGLCRAGSADRTLDYAHLVSRAQRGDDTADNIIPLGHEAHMLYHDHGKGWEHVAHQIRASLTPDELAYVLRKKGQDWLDEHYGLLSEGGRARELSVRDRMPSGDAPAPPSESSLLCAKCRRPLKTPGEPKKARPRKQKTISVPADELEDGLDVLDTLLEACGEELQRVRGGERRSTYYEIVDVLHDWLTTARTAA